MLAWGRCSLHHPHPLWLMVRGGLGDTSAAWMGKLRPRVCWRLVKMLRIPSWVSRIGLYSFLVGRCCPVPGSPGLEGWGPTCFYTPQDPSVMNESMRKRPKGTGSQTHQRNQSLCMLRCSTTPIANDAVYETPGAFNSTMFCSAFELEIRSLFVYLF